MHENFFDSAVYKFACVSENNKVNWHKFSYNNLRDSLSLYLIMMLFDIKTNGQIGL